ncbi:LOW QUALITY PROTEIN: UDP-glucosyltransferase 2-like [Musca domestica]|uniref:UDP-glucuronosyltransferase n=1 Tax=Musca domestica TaxID=7370 RepID=A0ABM3V3A3_MUSDO|nr:LOW QUALITY PROTEIN: UDP-glucosyltransferase 2-like [Musca domestica]
MVIRSILIFALFVSFAIFNSAEGAKILSIFPYSGPSQYIFISPLLKALAERGHEVTSISTFPQKKPLKNFRDVVVMENSKIFDEMVTELAAGEGAEKSFFEEFMELSNVPLCPNMIEVGGLHIKQKPDPLEEDLQKFLDNSPEGVIYFSMGSNVKSKDLPPQTLKDILSTFAELKIKVLWKFELEELPNKPANVVIRKWFNQPSILAHPNVKLFISHGGYLSTTETIFHGKPILGVPVMGDQFMNVKNSVKAGFALRLDLRSLTKEKFKQNIQELWTNPKYSNAVKKLSKRFRDQPLTPIETAIFWVEYVLRHDGASHIRNAGQDLSFWQYHNIDVYVILSSFIVVVFVLMAVFISFVKKIICGSSKKSKIKKN